MTNEHLITPPPELVHQWVDMLSSRSDQAVFTMAAQWGADQELEACCEWLECNYNYPQVNHPLRAARRPKPPSLKEQALGGCTGRLCQLPRRCPRKHHPPRIGGPR
jgi:hypothetical protein